MQWKQGFRKGRDLYESGNTKAALAEFSKCRSIEATDATLYVYIAAAECKMEHWTEAVSHLFPPADIHSNCIPM